MMTRFSAILIVVVVVADASVGVVAEDVKERPGALKRVTDDIKNNTDEIEALNYRELKESLESITCPKLGERSEQIPKNVDSDIKLAPTGTERKLLCSEGYFQCGTDAVARCEDDKTWKISNTSNCVKSTKTFTKPNKDEAIPIPCAMVRGTTISFTGTPKKNIDFFIGLMDNKEHSLMTNGYRFNKGGDRKKIVVNSYLGWWGSEQRSSRFPFQVGKDFTIDITRTSSGYEGFSAGTRLYTFKERSSSNPTKFKWAYYADMHSVTVKYP